MQLIQKLLSASELDLENGILQFDYDEDMVESVITVFTEKDGQITLAVFDPNQWEIVNDLCKLTDQDQEEVVRSLAKDLPNVYTFDPKDFI
jgi:hypothetical protein